MTWALLRQARLSPKPKVVRIVAVGDIACDPNSPYIKTPGYCQHDRVGALVKRLVKRGADSFVTLGDAQYETAKFNAFRAEFHPAFRDVRSVTKAVAGNHEYYADGARGHFRYWGKRAGTRQAALANVYACCWVAGSPARLEL